MLKHRLTISVVWFLIFFKTFVIGQTTLHFNWDHFLDNREYRNSVQIPQTILGMQSGVALSYKFDSTSTIYGGGNAMYEYGSRTKNVEPYITGYYQYLDKNYRLNVGLFPRKDILKYPLALLTDTLLYYRPNIEGAFFQYRTQNFYQNAWCDWTSKLATYDRENFLFGTSGGANFGPVFIHNYFVMLHNAMAIIRPPNDHIQDNGGIFVRAGLDLKSWIPLDSISIGAGGIQFIDRLRNVYDFKLNRGVIVEFNVQYKKYGINTLFFKGKGENMVFGDKFYRANQYTRIALSWSPISTKAISSRLELDFDITKGYVDSSQKFFISANIDKLFKH